MVKILYSILSFVFKIGRIIIPLDKKLVVFESFLGTSFACSPKYIYLYMVENGLDKEYRVIWMLNKEKSHLVDSGKSKVVIRNTFKYYWYLLRSKYLITNSRIPTFVMLNKNTVYFETWHGTPLKRLGLDQDNVLLNGLDKEEYRKRFIKKSAEWTYLLSQNSFSTKCFISAFGVKKEKIVELGYPRNDILSKNKKEKDFITKNTRIELGIDENKKIVLYAPTFRDNQHNKNTYSHSLNLDLKKVHKSLGDNYVVALRLHYLVSESLAGRLPDGVIDVSNYPDITKLYLVSDLLITDYSSVMFDFSLTNKPMYFYMYDLKEYRDILRGFYFDISELPGAILETEENLISALNDRDYEIKYRDKYQSFRNKYVYLDDGKAASRCVSLIFGRSNNGKE